AARDGGCEPPWMGPRRVLPLPAPPHGSTYEVPTKNIAALHQTCGIISYLWFILLRMNDLPHYASGQPPAVLVSAIRKLLRPLVRLMLSHQITYPYLISMLKSIYVEIADEDFKVAGKRQSDSRINLLTGVHRKDVKRLRAEPGQSLNTPKTISIGAQMIAYWTGSERFTDAEGKPRPLPLRGGSAPDPERPTFDDLVELVCRQDIRPRVILDEWQNMGIARLEDGGVTLNTGAFTPDKSFDEKAFFFGKNIHDHLSASTYNLL